LGFLKEVFRFQFLRVFNVFNGFFVRRSKTRKYDPKASGLSKHRILFTKDKSPVSEGEEHHVKNDDKTGESHKSQLIVEYEIYLLNYTMK